MERQIGPAIERLGYFVSGAGVAVVTSNQEPWVQVWGILTFLIGLTIIATAISGEGYRGGGFR